MVNYYSIIVQPNGGGSNLFSGYFTVENITGNEGVITHFYDFSQPSGNSYVDVYAGGNSIFDVSSIQFSSDGVNINTSNNSYFQTTFLSTNQAKFYYNSGNVIDTYSYPSGDNSTTTTHTFIITRFYKYYSFQLQPSNGGSDLINGYLTVEKYKINQNDNSTEGVVTHFYDYSIQNSNGYQDLLVAQGRFIMLLNFPLGITVDVHNIQQIQNTYPSSSTASLRFEANNNNGIQTFPQSIEINGQKVYCNFIVNPLDIEPSNSSNYFYFNLTTPIIYSPNLVLSNIAVSSLNSIISYTSSNSNIITIDNNNATVLGLGYSLLTATQDSNSIIISLNVVKSQFYSILVQLEGNTVFSGYFTVAYSTITHFYDYSQIVNGSYVDVYVNDGAYGEDSIFYISTENFSGGGTNIDTTNNSYFQTTYSGTNHANFYFDGTNTYIGTFFNSEETNLTDTVYTFIITNLDSEPVYNSNKYSNNLNLSFTSPIIFSPGRIVSLNATSNSNATILYTSSNTSIATIDGANAVVISAGSSNITASQDENSLYYSGSSSQTLTINKAQQSISFSVSPVVYSPGGVIPLNASSNVGLGVSYVSSNTSVATIDGANAVIVSVGSTDITASQSGDNNYNSAQDVETLTINKAQQLISFSVSPVIYSPGGVIPLNASSNVGLDVSYVSSNTDVATIDGANAVIVSVGSTDITASQSGDNNYNSAQDVETLTISKAQQLISFSVSPVIYSPGGVIPLNASSNVGLGVSYVSSNTSVATIDGANAVIVSVGSTDITASQSGNNNYSSAQDVETLTINKAQQSISFSVSPVVYSPGGVIPLNASSNVGLGVSYVSSNTDVATIDGANAVIVSVGSTDITASQSGNNNYSSAQDVETLTVSRANQEISFALTSPVIYAAGKKISLTGTSNVGLGVSYVSSNTNVATISGANVNVIRPGFTNITASQSGNIYYNSASSVVQPLTINKASQEISFALTSPVIYEGGKTVSLTQTSNVGLLVSYVSSNTSVASIIGSTLMLDGVGTTNITASQSGNVYYDSASSVVQPFSITKGNQRLSFTLSSPVIYGPGKTISLTGSSNVGLAVSYISSNTSVATVTGSTLTIFSVGSANITATQLGNNNYYSASNIIQPLTVNKASQVISFTLSSPIIYSAGQTIALNGTSNVGLSVSYVSSNTSVATVSGSTLNVIGIGSANITASQSGNNNYNSATSVIQSLTVNKATQQLSFTLSSPIVYAAGRTIALNGTSNVGLGVSYVSSNTSVATVSGSTLNVVGVGSTNVTASQSGNVYFSSATNVIQALTVNKANQLLSFLLNPSTTTYSYNGTQSLTGNSNISGLNVYFTSSNTTVGTITNSTFYILNTGTTTITCAQAGNVYFNAGGNVSQTLTINKSNQTITFPSLLNSYPWNSNISLSGSTNANGLGVKYTSSNTTVANVINSTIVPLYPGNTTITCYQNGNNNYNLAANVSQNVQITKATQGITFSLSNSTPSISQSNVSAISLSGSANSSLTITITSSDTNIAKVINNTTLLLVSSGNATITASQSGNDYYYSASSVIKSLSVNFNKSTTGSSTYLTSNVVVNCSTLMPYLGNINTVIPNIKYTNKGAGSYGYETGFSGLITQFTTTAYDIYNSNLTDFTTYPITLTLTIPHVNNYNKTLKLYKIQQDSSVPSGYSLMSPQPSGYPITATYRSGNNWTLSIPSLSSFALLDNNPPSGWLGGDPHIIDINGIKTTLPNNWKLVRLYEKDDLIVISKCEYINNNIIETLHRYTPNQKHEFVKINKYIHNYVAKYTYMTRLYVFVKNVLELEINLLDGKIIKNNNNIYLERVFDQQGLYSLTHEIFCPPKELVSYIIHLHAGDYIVVNIDKFWDDINCLVLYCSNPIDNYRGELILHNNANNLASDKIFTVSYLFGRKIEKLI